MGSIRKWLQVLPVENMLWSIFWQNEGIKFSDPVCGMCAAAPVQNSCGQSPHRISFSKAAENPPGWIWTGHRFRHAPVPSWHPYFSEWKIMYPSLYDLHIKATPHNGSCGLRRIFCPQSCSMKNGKYIQYSRIFHTFARVKISRRISLPHYAVLP